MKSILLIGLGRFGRHIARELNELGHQVMAIDSNEDRVNAVLSYVTNAQIGEKIRHNPYGNAYRDKCKCCKNVSSVLSRIL